MREEICAEVIHAIESLQKRTIIPNLFMRITNKSKLCRINLCE